VKVQAPDGTLVEAEEVDFDTESEPWTVVKVKDGSTIRIRLSVMKILRLEYNEPVTGDPLYIVQSQNMMRVSANPKLKKFQSVGKKEDPGSRPEVR
jgi:hypothetical protein